MCVEDYGPANPATEPPLTHNNGYLPGVEDDEDFTYLELALAKAKVSASIDASTIDTHTNELPTDDEAWLDAMEAARRVEQRLSPDMATKLVQEDVTCRLDLHQPAIPSAVGSTSPTTPSIESPLTANQERLIASLTQWQRSRLDAMPPGRRRSLLERFARGPDDPVLLDDLLAELGRGASLVARDPASCPEPDPDERQPAGPAPSSLDNAEHPDDDPK